MIRSFIELDTFISPVRYKISDDIELPKENIISAIKNCKNHIVLLGQPGAGKTTSMKYLSNKLLTDEFFFEDQLNFPIVIRLKEIEKLNPFKSVIFELYNLLGLIIEVTTRIKPQKIRIVGEAIPEIQTETKEDISKNFYTYQKLIETIVSEVLDDFKVLLILDGFDEVRKELRGQILHEIQQLAYRLNHSKIILTSRIGDFNQRIQNTSEFELCSLDNNQIKSFANKWLTPEHANDFLNQLIDSPFYDTSVRPLTIAHLCAIYQRETRIPKKPKTVYRKVVNLLLEEWDLQKSVIRVSKYNDFEADRKFDFLTNIAFELASKFNNVVFSKDQFEKIYTQICGNFGLPKYESKRVAEELESFTGLFLMSGYNHYEFAHKSIQEYLTAEFIVKLPYIPYDRGISNLPNETAICVAISSDSSEYFSMLAFEFFSRKGLNINFLNVFVERLIIEKPDFKLTPRLGISLLKLTTTFLIKGFGVEELKPLKLLYQLDSFRLSMFELRKFCSVNNDEFDLKDGTLMIQLEKIPIKKLKSFELPNSFLALEEFIEGW